MTRAIGCSGSGRYTFLGSRPKVASANRQRAQADGRMTKVVRCLVTPATEPEPPCGETATALDRSRRPTPRLSTPPPGSRPRLSCCHAHHLLASRRRTLCMVIGQVRLEGESVKGADLWVLCQKMEAIFQLHLLQQLGFTESEIQGILTNNCKLKCQAP